MSQFPSASRCLHMGTDAEDDNPESCDCQIVFLCWISTWEVVGARTLRLLRPGCPLSKVYPRLWSGHLAGSQLRIVQGPTHSLEGHCDPASRVKLQNGLISISEATRVLQLLPVNCFQSLCMIRSYSFLHCFFFFFLNPTKSDTLPFMVIIIPRRMTGYCNLQVGIGSRKIIQCATVITQLSHLKNVTWGVGGTKSPRGIETCRGAIASRSHDRQGSRKDVQSNCISLFEQQFCFNNSNRTERCPEGPVVQSQMYSNLGHMPTQRQNVSERWSEGMIGPRFINWWRLLPRTSFSRTDRQNCKYRLL